MWRYQTNVEKRAVGLPASDKRWVKNPKPWRRRDKSNTYQQPVTSDKPEHIRKARRMRTQARRKFEHLYKKQRGLCAECGKPMLRSAELLSERPTIDHKVRIADGGTNDVGNLEIVHGKCNQIRNRRHLPERQKHCRECGALKKNPSKRYCHECNVAFVQLKAGVGLA